MLSGAVLNETVVFFSPFTHTEKLISSALTSKKGPEGLFGDVRGKKECHQCANMSLPSKTKIRR